jgi:hypothetical protein
MEYDLNTEREREVPVERERALERWFCSFCIWRALKSER